MLLRAASSMAGEDEWEISIMDMDGFKHHGVCVCQCHVHSRTRFRSSYITVPFRRFSNMSQKVFKAQNSRLPISGNTIESCAHCAKARSGDEAPYKVCAGCRSVRYCVSVGLLSRIHVRLPLTARYSAKSTRSKTGPCIRHSVRICRTGKSS